MQETTSKPKLFRLRRIRNERRMSQRELARAAGVKVDTLSKLERDELNEWPRKTVGLLMRIAEILNVNPLELYNELVWQESPKEDQRAGEDD